jgi:hypothetical protein
MKTIYRTKSGRFRKETDEEYGQRMGNGALMIRRSSKILCERMANAYIESMKTPIFPLAAFKYDHCT